VITIPQRQRVGQTYGRTTCRGNVAHCVASRGNNQLAYSTYLVYALGCREMTDRTSRMTSRRKQRINWKLTPTGSLPTQCCDEWRKRRSHGDVVCLRHRHQPISGQLLLATRRWLFVWLWPIIDPAVSLSVRHTPIKLTRKRRLRKSNWHELQCTSCL